MSTWTCEQVQASFSAALDGVLSGAEMQALQQHSQQCTECRREMQAWLQMQQALASLAPRKAPTDLPLRLRVALSQARARSASRLADRWQMAWQNTVRPLAMQWSAGLASALAVLAGIGLLVGVFAAPAPVQASSAKDEPLGMATAPHYRYSMLPATSLVADVNSAIVVEVFVGADGRVYDYTIIGGEDSSGIRAQLNNVLYFTVFDPARVFGQAVRGHAVMSYAAVAVHG